MPWGAVKAPIGSKKAESPCCFVAWIFLSYESVTEAFQKNQFSDRRLTLIMSKNTLLLWAVLNPSECSFPGISILRKDWMLI